MAEFEGHQWFEPGELDSCPDCGEPAGVTLPATGSFVCLGCGHVVTAVAEPTDGTAPPA